MRSYRVLLAPRLSTSCIESATASKVLGIAPEAKALSLRRNVGNPKSSRRNSAAFVPGRTFILITSLALAVLLGCNDDGAANPCDFVCDANDTAIEMPERDAGKQDSGEDPENNPSSDAEISDAPEEVDAIDDNDDENDAGEQNDEEENDDDEQNDEEAGR